MGKRSNFERKERDFYATPRSAVLPLIPHLDAAVYYEPCAGDGALIDHLSEFGYHCEWATDIEPQRDDVIFGDMLKIEYGHGELIITNPPWDRKILHPFIQRVIDFRAHAWLLFDADWMHTKQSSELMQYCRCVVSVGRVKWFDNQTGKDNAAWYYFQPTETTTRFIGR